MKESATRKQRRILQRSGVPTMEKVSFKLSVKGQTISATARKTVQEFSCDKYTKVSSDLLHAMFPPESEMVSVETKVRICKTCDYTLKRGKMPAQAKANNMSLVNVSVVLSDLNPMEVRLISLRIPFVAVTGRKQTLFHSMWANSIRLYLKNASLKSLQIFCVPL